LLFDSVTTTDLFIEAKLKAQRAEKHINDLNAILGEFTKRKTHEVVIEHDPHGGDDLLKVRSIESLPTDFILTLGDAIHNLRASLDYAINEIEFLTIGERTIYTAFPARDTRDSLISAINGGLKQKAPKEIIDCIVDGIQPYRGGNGASILALHALDIEDKHRLLLTKVEFILVTRIIVEDDAGMEWSFDTDLFPEGRFSGISLKGCKNAKVNNQGQFSYTVRFGYTSPFALEPVIPTMRSLNKFVIAILLELERCFNGVQRKDFR
jgi:hypothetical protein